MCYGGCFAVWTFAKPNGNRRDEKSDGNNEESIIERHNKRFPGHYRFDHSISLFKRSDGIEAFLDEGLLKRGDTRLGLRDVSGDCFADAKIVKLFATCDERRQNGNPETAPEITAT